MAEGVNVSPARIDRMVQIRVFCSIQLMVRVLSANASRGFGLQYTILSENRLTAQPEPRFRIPDS